MNLQDLARKIKSLPDIRNDVFVSLTVVIFLIIGYLVATEVRARTERRGELRLVAEAKEGANILTKVNNSSEILGRFVASKNGSSFHLPWCSGAKKIKDSNKIWFNKKEEAVAAGYKPAGNCEGI